MTLQHRKQRLTRERMLIALFLVRQCASIAVLGALVVLSLKLPDRRMAYVLGPVAFGFTAFVLVLTVRFFRTYRARKRRVDAREATT